MRHAFRVTHPLHVLGLLTLGGCLPFGLGKGDPKPAPPVETPETTAKRADSLFKAGSAQFRAGRWGNAAKTLDRAVLIMNYDDPRRPLAHFMMGEIFMAQDNQLQAVRELRRVADEGGADSLAADALLRAGDAYAALWRKPELDPTYGETALATYREVQQRYEGTSAARRAGGRINALQEQFAAKEYRTALFYYRLKAYDSAILSLRNVVATWPRTRVVPDALVKLVETYSKLEYQEDLIESCKYIARFFPDTAPRVAPVCPAAEPAGTR
jgi:outer membrane protein assembly factor BamD